MKETTINPINRISDKSERKCVEGKWKGYQNLVNIDDRFRTALHRNLVSSFRKNDLRSNEVGERERVE